MSGGFLLRPVPPLARPWGFFSGQSLGQSPAFGRNLAGNLGGFGWAISGLWAEYLSHISAMCIPYGFPFGHTFRP